MLTQKQIADKLGLAQITVSRVLNNHPSVKPATRARVLAALGRGYALNVNARNLVLGRSGRLALVIPDAGAFKSPFLPLAMAGIAGEFRAGAITRLFSWICRACAGRRMWPANCGRGCLHRFQFRQDAPSFF